MKDDASPPPAKMPAPALQASVGEHGEIHYSSFLQGHGHP
jgi:hypothetical protein